MTVFDIRIRTAAVLVCMLAAACTSRKENDEPPVTELPFSKITLSNLDEISRDESDGWAIAGNVFMDRNGAANCSLEEGEGVLVNPSGEKKLLTTTIDHEDLDLKLDFMLSKESSAALLFQGRYVLRLTDGWNEDGVSTSGSGAMATAADNNALPLINDVKAPGLWQHLSVKFKAPRFDASGKKVSNALFKEVILNGKTIQQNVEVADVSAQAPLKEEGAGGFLVIGSEGGAVAFQNIQFKAYAGNRIAVHDMQFKVFKGLYKEYDTLDDMTPLRAGKTDSLHWAVGDKRAQIVFDGKMNVPVDGDYVFGIRAAGPAWLLIDGKDVVNNDDTRNFTQSFYSMLPLKEGDHDFTIVYANYGESLVVEYEGPGIPLTPLTAPSSERKRWELEPFEYVVNKEPGIQRGFFTHHGKVNTYTMSVGTPGGLNYAYDMSTCNLLSVWRGKFIDVSNMWTDRGESQMEIPLGTPLELAGIPPVLQLNDEEDVWIDTVQADNNIYTARGYRLDDAGLPVFLYTYKNVKIEDQISPTENKEGFIRKITTTFEQPLTNCYFLLGCGTRVEKLPNSGYAIDDKEYYIEPAAGVDESKLSVVKAKNGRYELLYPLSGEVNQVRHFSYSIIW